MKIASGLSGVESVSIDKDHKLTVTGDVDPVKAAQKLGKLCYTEIVSVGPAKEPEKKKEEPKKEEPKKPDSKKEDTVTYPYPMMCHPLTAQYYTPAPNYYACCTPVEEYSPGCVISLDKDQKLTLTGDIDPVVAVRKLRKVCYTEIVSVGPAKEPEKEKVACMPCPVKKPADTSKDPPKGVVIKYVYRPSMPQYYPPVPDYHSYGKSVEEDPAGCVIC
ncbi:hypothetical protein Gotur_018099 [Gossypium turneri]